MTDAPEISATLARHVRSGAVPPGARAVTRSAVADAIGVMTAASGLGEGCDAFVALAREGGEGGACTVLGFDFRASPIMAAFANGAMAHALDFEDTHDATLVHPHAAVVPAALAVAEFAGGVSGRDFLDAVTIGADISCRLALGLTESAEKRGFYFIPMLSAYGAAAAAARLLKLSEQEIVQSLALASCQAVFSDALVSYPPSHLRAVRDGFSARAGVTAALLARRGLRAFDRPIEGPGGLYANYARGRFDAVRMLHALGDEYEGAKVSFKPWPSCRGTHAFVEAALSLARDHSVDIERIARVDVTVSPFFAILCEPPQQKRRPKTAIDAKFSIPFTVALALRQGDVTLRDFSPERLADPELHVLADKVHHVVEPGWTLEQSTRGALTLSLADGRRLAREVIDPLGHPLNPMDERAMRRKFEDCIASARHSRDPAIARQLAERLDRIEKIADMRELFFQSTA
ncbi:MAG: MmgE/PrpD family protein [Pseudorhodoplanes sp.]|uniref:MmgE/PrpD family protein n=1 Tax=Pseudorhodoplanes sp. TaxID=1934341 RepID=UPI003D0B87CF